MKAAYVKSGKVGNVVYSRNRHGPICFARFIPSNPRTAKQMAVRQLWAMIAALWRLLTDEQRAQWRAAGRQQRTRRRLGQSAPLTGFHYFMRVNMRRAHRGDAWVAVPEERGRVERESVRRGSVRKAAGALRRPTCGVAAVLLPCTNGILDHALRRWEGARTVFRAAETGRRVCAEPLYADMS